MNKIIRILVFLDFIVIGALGVAEFLLEGHLPIELQNYVSQSLESELSGFGWLVTSVTIVVLIIHVTSLLGLFFHKKWAEKFFMTTTFMLIFLCLTYGPSVSNAVSHTLDQLSLLIEGMILSLLLFGKTISQHQRERA